MKITKEMYASCRDALAINDGASNVCGTSAALNRAYLTWNKAGYDIILANRNPAAKLILQHLCFLSEVRTAVSFKKHDKWITECKSIMTQYEEQEEARIQEVNNEA